MSQSGVNYKAVLSDLRLRRSRLDAAIAAIEGILEETSSHQNPTLLRVDDDVPMPKQMFGSYAGSTIVAAAKHYLERSGKPLKTGVIVEGLRRGGA